MIDASFISTSPQVEQVKKGLLLAQSLMVALAVVGERYTGKSTLVHSLFPKAGRVDAGNIDELEKMLLSHDEIVIENFEQITDLGWLNFDNKRIIALVNTPEPGRLLEEKFAFIHRMPPLRERPEDVAYLVEYFSHKAREELMLADDKTINPESVDLSDNIQSLRAYVYKELLFAGVTGEDIERLLFGYFLERLEGKNAYRDHLELFEKPLIMAGLSKYGSQVKLADVLGLNRNTLRKKIYEHDID